MTDIKAETLALCDRNQRMNSMIYAFSRTIINKFKTLNPYSRIIPIDRNFENTVRIQSNVC